MQLFGQKVMGDEYYYIVRGSIIRSRATWYAERNTKYFLNLEKQQKKKNVALGNYSFQMENRPQMLMSCILKEMYINFYSYP